MDNYTDLIQLIDRVHSRLDGLPEPEMVHFPTCYDLHYYCLVKKLYELAHEC